MEKNTLAEAREEIDRIDEEMARLFVRRMYVVSHIADDK